MYSRGGGRRSSVCDLQSRPKGGLNRLCDGPQSRKEAKSVRLQNSFNVLFAIFFVVVMKGEGLECQDCCWVGHLLVVFHLVAKPFSSTFLWTSPVDRVRYFYPTSRGSLALLFSTLFPITERNSQQRQQQCCCCYFIRFKSFLKECYKVNNAALQQQQNQQQQ